MELALDFNIRGSEVLTKYAREDVFERYRALDIYAHGREHINTVLKNILDIAKQFHLDRDLCALIALFHDLGQLEGRYEHERRSREIFLSDEVVEKYVSCYERLLIANGIEEHRSSLGREPLTMYGKAIAEADRDLNPTTMCIRYIRSGYLNQTAEKETFEGFRNRVFSELQKRYGESGFCKLWLNTERNTRDLEELRLWLSSKEEFGERLGRVLQSIEC